MESGEFEDNNEGPEEKGQISLLKVSRIKNILQSVELQIEVCGHQGWGSDA